MHREQLLRAAMQVPNGWLGEVIESTVESRNEGIYLGVYRCGRNQRSGTQVHGLRHC